MKKILIITAILSTMALAHMCCGISASAQGFTVVYEAKTGSEATLDKSAKSKAKKVPKSYTKMFQDIVYKYRLIYINGESDFRMLPFDKPQSVSVGKITMDASAFIDAKDFTYKNHSEGLFIKPDPQIEGQFNSLPIPAIKYEIEETGETKTILGHECHKITVSEQGYLMTFWVTTDLSAVNEPFAFGVPGVALMAEDPLNTYTAIEILDYPATDITRPDGTVISAQNSADDTGND